MSTHYRAARIIGRGRFLAPLVFARFEQGEAIAHAMRRRADSSRVSRRGSRLPILDAHSVSFLTDAFAWGV
jgi:hypothetical protein